MEVSSSSLTVRSGTVPPQKTILARRAKRFILTSRAGRRRVFGGMGLRKRWGQSL